MFRLGIKTTHFACISIKIDNLDVLKIDDLNYGVLFYKFNLDLFLLLDSFDKWGPRM